MACKVDRAVDRFDLTATAGHEGVDAELLARWRGEDRPEQGYRTLTDWFNRRLLRRVYDDHGRETVGTRVESDYEALTGDDRLLREEVLDDMRADGIAADAVADALVSWSTMRHHLKDCLDGSKPTRESDSDWERRSVDIATDRAAGKVADAARALASKGELAGGDDAEATVEPYLSCPHCGVRVPFSEARSRGYVCADHLGTPGDGDHGPDGADAG
jgi:hypothetical protein